MRKAKAIVKFFPKGYIIHKEFTLERFEAPYDCWYVIEHHGQAKDGIEVYETLGRTRPYHSKQEAIKQLQYLRKIGHAE